MAEEEQLQVRSLAELGISAPSAFKLIKKA